LHATKKTIIVSTAGTFVTVHCAPLQILETCTHPLAAFSVLTA